MTRKAVEPLRLRRSLSAAGGIALLFAGAVYIFAHSKGAPAPSMPFGGKVKRISGDRIHLADGRHVELAGMRLPYDGEPAAADARSALATWLNDRDVRLLFDETREFKKKRLLAYVYAKDSSINERLVRDGLGYVKLREGNRRFAKELLGAQAEAIAESRGLWAAVKANRGGRFVMEPERGTFHLATCQMIQNKNNLVEVGSPAEAFAQGAAPCGICQPCADSH